MGPRALVLAPHYLPRVSLRASRGPPIWPGASDAARASRDPGCHVVIFPAVMPRRWASWGEYGAGLRAVVCRAGGRGGRARMQVAPPYCWDAQRSTSSDRGG